MKPGEVTITRQPQAHVTMQVDFNLAANITISGVTLTYAHLADSRTHDIIIRNAYVPDKVWISGLYDSDVVLARNDFHDFEICSTCAEGRVYVTGGDHPSGGLDRRTRGSTAGFQRCYSERFVRDASIIGNEFYGLALELGRRGARRRDPALRLQPHGDPGQLVARSARRGGIIMAADGADDERSRTTCSRAARANTRSSPCSPTTRR